MSNPYMPVPGPPPPPKEAFPTKPMALGPSRMEYMRAYNYIFENPNWMMNVLWGFLCILSTGVIPVVGQLVFFGYQFEIVEALYLSRGARYPDFDVNRFGEYLMRGLWPFLVQLVISVIVVPLMIVLMFVGMLLLGSAGAAGGDEAAAVFMLIGMPLLFLLIIALSVAFSVVMTPFVLRAGLTQDFGQAMNFAWARDFISKVWVETLLAALFLSVTSMLAVLLGLLVFCIGMYAATAVVFMAWGHLLYQLYNLYLARGGEPIPLKAQNPPPAFAPMGPPPPPPPR